MGLSCAKEAGGSKRKHAPAAPAPPPEKAATDCAAGKAARRENVVRELSLSCMYSRSNLTEDEDNAEQTAQGTADSTEIDSHVVFTRTIKRTITSCGTKVINQYEVIDKLGVGGYGKVKLVLNTTNGKLYAMKILNKKRLSQIRWGGRNALNNVRREIAVLQRLYHPNILTLHEVIDCETDEKMYMITDYCSRGCVVKWDSFSHRVITESDERDIRLSDFTGIDLLSDTCKAPTPTPAPTPTVGVTDEGATPKTPALSSGHLVPLLPVLPRPTGGMGSPLGNLHWPGFPFTSSNQSEGGDDGDDNTTVATSEKEHLLYDEPKTSAPCIMVEPPTPAPGREHQLASMPSQYTDNGYIAPPTSNTGSTHSLLTSPTTWSHVASVAQPGVTTISDVLQGVVRGLKHCHLLGVAHRDLKPSNILIDEVGCVKIADFGAAILFGDDGQIITDIPPVHTEDEVLTPLASPYRTEGRRRSAVTLTPMSSPQRGVLMTPPLSPLSPGVLSIEHSLSRRERGWFSNYSTAEGTPAFWSPEVFSPDYSPSLFICAMGDCWSLGVLLFHLLTQSLPFTGDGQSALKNSIINKPVPSIQTHQSIQEVINGLLQKVSVERINLDDLIADEEFWTALATSPQG